MLDLNARLDRASLETAKYTDPRTQEEVILYFHHPSGGESGLALSLAGLELSDENGIQHVAEAKHKGLAGMGLAMETYRYNLACICVEKVEISGENLEGIREEEVPGTFSLSKEARSKLYAPSLKKLGAYLVGKKEVSEDEKKDSEPLSSGD